MFHAHVCDISISLVTLCSVRTNSPSRRTVKMRTPLLLNPDAVVCSRLGRVASGSPLSKTKEANFVSRTRRRQSTSSPLTGEVGKRVNSILAL
ncbi:hypothetical protein AOLI_G00244230 [Acnodon oligacanthus]